MPTQFFTTGIDRFTVVADEEYYLTFLAGDDVLDVRGGLQTIAAMGDGNDRVALRDSDALIYGESGSDRFDAYSGGTIYGGEDDDLVAIYGGSGLTAYGDAGDDRFNFAAAASDFLLNGGIGNDVFGGYGFASTGTIHGGDGSDLFTGFGSGVTIHGDAGDDTYRVAIDSNAVLVEAADEGTDTVQLARGADYVLPDNIENIVVGTYAGSDDSAATITANGLDNYVQGHGNAETIFGLGGNDTIFGKAGNDILDGGDGNDLLDGGAGDDMLNGGDGNDTLVGRDGNDIMAGGAGDDSYYIDSGDTVIENVGEGTDTIRSSTALTLGDNIENGVLNGSASVNLTGNALDNVLNGNAGDNILFGDDGADTLIGGSGADTFLFTSISDSLPGQMDSIQDFQSGVDTIDLSAIDANTNVDGDQAFAPGTGLYLSPTANALWYQGDVIYGDVDGDAVADFAFEIHLTGGFFPAGDIIF
jgi:Ca2+-binding RTX toxin-like protein